MKIGKRQLNKIVKSLDRILNLRNVEYIESIFSMRLDPPLNHNLTIESINQFFYANTHLSEFEILNELLSEIININPNNYSRLFSIYCLLAEKAKSEGNILYTKYSKLAFKYYALRQLRGLKDCGETSFYMYLICRPTTSCSECQHLDNKVFSADVFLDELPIPTEKCTNEYLCSCTLTAISENAYLRFKKEKRIS